MPDIAGIAFMVSMSMATNDNLSSKTPVNPVMPDRSSSFDVPSWVAYAGSVSAAILAFLPVLPHIASDYIGSPYCDINLAYRHFVHFAVSSVRGGEIPLWNPFIFCGSPFLPGMSATLFDPLNWPFLLLLQQPLSMNLVIIMHFILLGAGTVHYTRERGCSNISALFSGITVVLSSTLVCRAFAGHFTIVCTAAWIPLLFCLQERMFVVGARYIVPFGAVAACMFLGGHLQYAYYAGLLLAFHVVAWGIIERRQIGHAGWWILRQAGYHAAAGCIAFALAAVEVVPAIDIVRHSARNIQHDENWLRFFSMPPESFLTLFVPRLFGSHIDYWGRWYWWEVCYYLGISGFVFCLTVIILRICLRIITPMVVLLIISLFLACAAYIPLVQLVLQWIPGWPLFRGHTKIGSYGVIFAILLAAEGFDAVRSDLCGKAARIAKMLLLVIGLISLVLLVIPGETWLDLINLPSVARDHMTPSTPRGDPAIGEVAEAARLAAFIAVLWSACGFILLTLGKKLPAPAWNAAAIALVLADMAVFALPTCFISFDRRAMPFPQSQAAYYQPMRGQWRADAPDNDIMNQGMTLGIEAFGGNDVTVTKYFDTLACAYFQREKGAPNLAVTIDRESPILDAANVGYVGLHQQNARNVSPFLRKECDAGNSVIFKRTTALPRAYVVGSALWVEDDENAILAALGKGLDFHREVLLVGRPEPGTGESFEAVPTPAEYRGLHEVHVKAPRDGWLTLTDSFYPAWKATVSGHPVEILRANSAFRAVKVKAGDEVVFQYSNNAFLAGATVSVVALCLLAGWSIILILRKPTQKNT
ncbi:MAG: hypothetical protein WCK47_02525 [bacterium]